jgi:hypothetical protein
VPTEKTVTVGIAQSTLHRIHDAIDLLYESKIESAIVLAHAAEGQLPETGKPHLFHKLKAFADSLPDEPGAKGPNDFVVWLKHGEVRNVKYENAVISENEAILSVARAVSKYNAVSGGISPKMGEFVDWAIKRVQDSKD